MKSVHKIFTLGRYKIFGWDIHPTKGISPIFKSKTPMNRGEYEAAVEKIVSYLGAEGFLD